MPAVEEKMKLMQSLCFSIILNKLIDPITLFS